MRTDINEVFSKGDKPLIEFLDYCVRSIQMDLVFMFLVREYHNGPTAAKAAALYDLFCAPNAPGRLSAHRILPPYDVRLWKAMRPLTLKSTLPDGTDSAAQTGFCPPLLPAKYLFDSVVHELEKRSPSSAYVRRYKPNRTPVQNLPSGKMTQAQRHFVERVWEPVIRPQLVAAGFWRIATVA